jgi:tetratricopeptide (TPR) repeat protein
MSGERKGLSTFQILILVGNLAFVAIVVLYFVISGVGRKEVKPLVEASPKTQQRISELEQLLARDPGNVGSAVELARLYRDVGEFPWSYDALKNAERSGNEDPAWRIKLGLAYLEIGKNDDGLRILKAARERCYRATPKCRQDLLTKLDIFHRLAEIFVERKIDSRKHLVAVNKAFQEVLKPVSADPAKIRPKAPAVPPSSAPSTPSEK